MKPKQLKLLKSFHRKRRERPLRPATKDCAQCENMLGHFTNTDGGRFRLPATRCQHKGRPYTVNGFLKMVLCICCAGKMKKKAPGFKLKEAA